VVIAFCGRCDRFCNMELDLPPVSKCEKCKVVAQWRSVAELDDERQLILPGGLKVRL
jgi:hypothetical protein